MKIKTIIESLRHCTINEGDCRSCPSYHHDSGCLDRLHVKAAAALESQQKRIAELEAQNRWIPVTERLPANFVSVLGYMPAAAPFPPVRECYTAGNAFYFPALTDTQMVTHWMPLPVPPKEVTR